MSGAGRRGWWALALLLGLGACAWRASAPPAPDPWTVRAAESGNAAAQTALGDASCCDDPGGGGAADTARATEWWCQAARQGHAPAMQRLGRLYAGIGGAADRPEGGPAPGLGPEHDVLELAHVWLAEAARRRMPGAAEERQRVADFMTPQQGARALALQSRWPVMPCRWFDVFPRGT